MKLRDRMRLLFSKTKVSIDKGKPGADKSCEVEYKVIDGKMFIKRVTFTD